MALTANSRYGCPVLYVGRFAHFIFGIHASTLDTPKNINPEMWATSDLGRFTNVDKIDGGRYV